MSELYLRDVSKFKLFFTTIKNIVENVKIEITTDGLVCKVLDESKGMFINIKFNYGYFEYIKLDDNVTEENIVLYTDDLANVLKNITAEDTLRIRIFDDSVEFIINNEQSNRKLLLTQLSKDYTINSPDDFTGETSFNMPFSVLKTVLAELSVFGIKHVEISVDDDGVKFYNDDFTNLSEYVNHCYTNFTGSAAGVYSIDYLKILNKFNTLAEDIDLEMNTNSPLKAHVISLNTELSFLIAPYVFSSDLEDSEEDY
jgi:DNA polymerase III sliding clamp (beta) subunit (PCNA family)